MLPVTFEILTKVIVNRLKEVLPQLVLLNQTSFVPCKHIQENIVIAQEAIHSMSKLQGKHGYMIIKIDLEKAYNLLRWSFIEETLHILGIQWPITQLIMKCITSSTKQVLWNGETTEEFLPNRGIRQGDPFITLYLCVMHRKIIPPYQ